MLIFSKTEIAFENLVDLFQQHPIMRLFTFLKKLTILVIDQLIQMPTYSLDSSRNLHYEKQSLPSVHSYVCV